MGLLASFVDEVAADPGLQEDGPAFVKAVLAGVVDGGGVKVVGQAQL